jgi:hypothetical protein
MNQRNTKFANAVRAGKKATHESQAAKRLHKSPLSAVALGVIVFVVVGGGADPQPTLVLADQTNQKCLQ